MYTRWTTSVGHWIIPSEWPSRPVSGSEGMTPVTLSDPKLRKETHNLSPGIPYTKAKAQSGLRQLLYIVVLDCIGVYWPYGVSRKCAVGKLKPKWHTHTHTQMYIQICESTIYQSKPSDLTKSLHFLLCSIYLHGPLKPRSQLAENALSCFFCSGCNCKNANVSLDFSNLVLESHQDFQKWHTKHVSALEILMSV